MHKRILICLMVLLVAFAVPALAEEARDITTECTLLAGGRKTKSRPMMDRSYTTYYELKKGGVLQAESPEEDISGVFLQFYERSNPVEIQVEQGEAWQTVAAGEGNHLSDWFPLPEGTRKVRVINTGKARMFLAELTIYGQGEKPARTVQWQDLDKADMLLVVAHPDDELLWFGGLLPTYAGQRDLKVQVAYLVPSTPRRRLELLDGLATCGVDAYPLFGGLRDVRSDTLKGQYKLWKKKTVMTRVVEMIRKVQPEVLVTQDVNGEYGHGAHRVCADACMLAVEQAADTAKYKDSAKAYGPWQVKKMYIHLYGENQLRMDWREPLPAFGGKDSFTVASEALACHVSQVKHGWAMEEGGEMDNSLFGLYHSTVGEDVLGNDLMENVFK